MGDPHSADLQPLSAILMRSIGQVGILVFDLDAALERYTRRLGLEPWYCLTMGPEIMSDMGYRGRPGQFAMRIALSGVGSQVELVEPIRGPSVYEEWLAEHGEGIHHLGFHVPSIDEAMASMSEAGLHPIEWGRVTGSVAMAASLTTTSDHYYCEHRAHRDSPPAPPRGQCLPAGPRSRWLMSGIARSETTAKSCGDCAQAM
jgi:catechol 2,3-dioxygenase-like lactoylglutathione lyase family enzyme